MGKLDKFKKTGSTSLSQTLDNQMDVVLTAELPEDKNKVVNIELSKIKPNPNNDYNRYDATEGINSLREDIERNGLLHNLVVSKRNNDEYVLISGERRYRALSLLHEKEQKNGGDAGKYRFVPCRVVEGLSERQEMIMLDAANLQARGGAGNEVLSRKSAVRYRDNVKAEYGLSEAQARALLEQISSLSAASISANILIQSSLDKRLVDCLDRGVIKKNTARQFLKLTEKQQAVAADTIEKIEKTFEKGTDRYAAILAKAVEGFSEAAEEITVKKADLAIEGVCAIVNDEVAKEKQNAEKGLKNRSEKIQQAKQTHQKEKTESQRDFYLNKCDKAIKVVEELSREKTIGRIKRFDSVSQEENRKIIRKVEELIELATRLKQELGGE